MIEVYEQETETERRVWRFYVGAELGGSPVVTLRLRYFAIQRRATPRHKWRSEPAERWDAMDERDYHSGLSRGDILVSTFVEARARRIAFEAMVVEWPEVKPS